MKITGEYLLSANPDELWEMLNDPKVLEKVTPGIKTLEAQGEDSYKAISEVKIGPVKGEFKGGIGSGLHIYGKAKFGP